MSNSTEVNSLYYFYWVLVYNNVIILDVSGSDVICWCTSIVSCLCIELWWIIFVLQLLPRTIRLIGHWYSSDECNRLQSLPVFNGTYSLFHPSYCCCVKENNLSHWPHMFNTFRENNKWPRITNDTILATDISSEKFCQ